jgi:hypothetical protein
MPSQARKDAPVTLRLTAEGIRRLKELRRSVSFMEGTDVTQGEVAERGINLLWEKTQGEKP